MFPEHGNADYNIDIVFFKESATIFILLLLKMLLHISREVIS